MDCESLIESLWRDGEKKIQEIEAETKEEVDRIETEISLKITALKENCDKNVFSDSEKRAEDILAEAEQRAALIGISTSRELSVRLYQLARGSLLLLRNERYGDVFTALAAELPSLPWKSVRVNPGDAGIARQCFPGAEIVVDEAISGGMDVMTADGKIRIISTFEKRLERAWEEMISDLLQEAYETL
jgi:vacuolar-type H+-ATPase subunit E/Vma4